VKTRTVVTGLALGALAAVAGLSVVLRPDPRRRNFEVLPRDMVVSPAAITQGTTRGFPDGRVQREPPAGSIARGLLPLEYGPSLEEAARAGREMKNPFGDEPEVLARGERVFTNVCAACHGLSGLGDAAATKRGFPPPPSLLRPESKALADGEMFHATTFGRRNMPPLASMVDREDRWKAIRFLRRLQEGAP